MFRTKYLFQHDMHDVRNTSTMYENSAASKTMFRRRGNITD